MSIPKMRFYGYDSSWKVSKLGELFEIYSGNTPSRSDRNNYDNGTIPWIKTTDLNNSLIYVNEEKITDHGAKKLKTLPKNTILIAMYGGFNQIGRTGLLTYPATINQALASLLPVKEINSYFLLNYLNLRKDSWRNVAASSRKDPNITKNDVEKFKISFPSLEEQSAIGSLFRILDDLLASYKENLANYQSLKATMLSKMFPKAGLTVPEIHLYGFEGEWEVQILKEIASFSKGNGYTKNDLVNSGKEIILYGRLYTNYQTVISKVNTFVTTVKANTVLSKGGEVIVPASGESAKDISRASVVEKSGIILGGDLNIIYPDRNKVNSIFLALTISNGSQQKELIKRAQGKSVVHLRNNDLEKVVLHYPSMEEQQAIGSYFSNLDQLITSYQEKITQLETLKKKLLQDMFV